MCVPCCRPPVGFVSQPTNQNLFGFEAQIKKPPWWFWPQNHQTIVTDFETQTRKPEAIDFDVKLKETITFKVKPDKTVATDFNAKPVKNILFVLWSNYWQTIDLDFEAQPRNIRSSSPYARYRPHMASPDLPIVRLPSTWPVRPSLVLCIRPPTHTMILITVWHAAPVICTLWNKQTWFSTQTKIKVKQIEMSWIWIQTSACQWLITYQIKELTSWFLRMLSNYNKWLKKGRLSNQNKWLIED
jgi:hypothetical protein